MFTVIDGRSEPAIRRAHRGAISRGALQAAEADAAPDVDDPSHALMCAAARHALDLALLTQTFETHAGIVGHPADALMAPLVCALRDESAAVVRTTWQALQVHARDVGYSAERWEDRAVAVTSDVLSDEGGSLDSPVRPADVARAAGLEVTCALQATAEDRMAVPGHLAGAEGLAAALFMLARELSSP
jgi:hypothetical protein